uniref:UGPA n=1 Tax=Arundo donax TaxID=35708 RepID=A0A0A9AP28_ARUDO
MTDLGPVQPMVVPRPPLSLSTTSLSSSFFVASRSSGGGERASYGTTTSSVGVWILLHSICSASPLR